MPLLIDGHNLIGVLPDIQLGDRADEARLVGQLRAYRARRGGPPFIVFFDRGAFLPDPGRAPSTRASELSTPGVQVRFAGAGQTADDAIIAYLESRAGPRQYTVVTDDQGLARQARTAGSEVMRAAEFAVKLAEGAGAESGEPERARLEPRDPAFADIYAGFLAAEKARMRAPERTRFDPEPWVEQLYGGDVQQAQAAARWLGLYRGPEALPALRDALTHEDVRVRAAALLALGDLADRAALPDLCLVLREDHAGMAREAAAQSLGLIGDRSVEQALMASAKTDTKAKVRKAAASALAQIRARSAAESGIQKAG